MSLVNYDKNYTSNYIRILIDSFLVEGKNNFKRYESRWAQLPNWGIKCAHGDLPTKLGTKRDAEVRQLLF